LRKYPAKKSLPLSDQGLLLALARISLPNEFSAIHERYSARLRQVYRRSNFGEMFPDDRPVVRGQRYNPESSPYDPVLIFDPLIACNEHFEACALECLEQVAILQAAPALMGHGCHIVARKVAEQIMRDVFVEQDSQYPSSMGKLGLPRLGEGKEHSDLVGRQGGIVLMNSVNALAKLSILHDRVGEDARTFNDGAS
jgi:hypothetical protein